MKITFLGSGTSHGVPVVGCFCRVCASSDPRDQRLRTSVHLAIAGKSIVIDAGPDFRQQMLLNRISHLDAILFTHEHKDHTGGLDDIRGFNLFQPDPIPIYARDPVLAQLRREYAYIFAGDGYPNTPQIAVHPITNHPFDVQGVSFTPIEVQHYQLSVLGFRTGEFTYITDAKQISDSEKEKIRGTHTLVVNALHYAPNVAHFTVDEALALVEEVQPQQAYFVHMSHEIGLHREVDKTLPDRVALAYDGLRITVGE